MVLDVISLAELEKSHVSKVQRAAPPFQPVIDGALSSRSPQFNAVLADVVAPLLHSHFHRGRQN